MTEGTEKDPVNLDTVDFRPFFFYCSEIYIT